MRFHIIDKMKLTPFELRVFAIMANNPEDDWDLVTLTEEASDYKPRKGQIDPDVSAAVDILILSGLIDWTDRDIKTAQLNEMGVMWWEENQPEIEEILEDYELMPIFISPPVSDPGVLEELSGIFRRKVVNEKTNEEVGEKGS
jgi:hypothetical protein